MIKTYRGRTFVDVPRLRAVRDESGVTQGHLAEVSGVSRINITRIESGRRTTWQTMEKLASALGVEPEDLMAEPAAPTASLLEIGQEGAGELEERYLDHFAGGEHADPMYEEGIADAYLRIVRDEGTTDEAIKRAIRRALVLGKERGKELA